MATIYKTGSIVGDVDSTDGADIDIAMEPDE